MIMIKVHLVGHLDKCNFLLVIEKVEDFCLLGMHSRSPRNLAAADEEGN